MFPYRNEERIWIWLIKNQVGAVPKLPEKENARGEMLGGDSLHKGKRISAYKACQHL